jgi:cyanophycin synthetase
VARIPRTIVYFSLEEDSPVVRRHLDAGGTAYALKGGWIVESRGEYESRVAEAAAIPATLGGSATFQVANVMAALAACRAHGLDAASVVTALTGFRQDLHNPGRTNLYRVGHGFVLVDYGHNPDAFRSICRMAAFWENRTKIGVVGLPGDRDDSVVAQAAAEAAVGFDRIVLREDADLRGRRPGEMVEIMERAIKAAAPDREVTFVPEVGEALRTALGLMAPGDIVVVFYEKLGRVLEVLREHGAEAASEAEVFAARARPAERAPADVKGA